MLPIVKLILFIVIISTNTNGSMIKIISIILSKFLIFTMKLS